MKKPQERAGTDVSGAGAAPVVVVGAGIVGACVAYELRKRGHEVALIDRDEPGRGASFGNSGAISPGSVVPLAMPSVLGSVPGMLLDPSAPLYVPPSYLVKAFPWLARFVASARPERVRAISASLAAPDPTRREAQWLNMFWLVRTRWPRVAGSLTRSPSAAWVPDARTDTA